MLKMLRVCVVLLCLSNVAGYAAVMPSSVYTEKNPNIAVLSSHPQFEIKLSSNPTTGYSWFLQEYNARLLEPVKHVYQAPENKNGLVGAPGFERWTFRVKSASFVVPQQTKIRFVYVRPWETADSVKQQVFTVTIRKR